MNAISLLTPETTRAMGWTLVHFLWEGVVLAAFLYTLLAFSRRALVRYNIAVFTLLMMFVCPIVTFLVLKHKPDSAGQLGPWKDAIGTIQAFTTSPAPLPVSAAMSLASVDWLSCFVSLWLIGVLVFGVRALGGWIALERLHREKSEALSAALRERCLALQWRVGISGTVRFLQSRLIEAPAVMGWFRPIVLLPISALTGLSARQLETVIVHELAHIKRFDTFVNLFQIAVETLLFYHPAVWWVSRCIRAERENCCDDMAVAICGNAGDYAKALTLMETWRATPALVLAANSGSLKSRISRLLGFESITRSVPRGGLAVIGLLCAAGALLATTFNVTIANKNDFDYIHSDSAQDLSAPAAPERRVSVPSYPAPRAAVSAHRAEKREALALLAQNRARVAYVEIAQNVPEAPAAPAAPEAPPQKPSYIDGMNSAGLKNISVDDLIALKIQGVTPEYVRQMRAAGFNPSVHELIAMKIQGVSPEYAREVQASGLNPALNDLIAMRTMGVSLDYVRQVRSAWPSATIHQIIAMKTQGVAPDDVAEYRKLGLKDVTLDQMIALRIQGVSPDYIRAMQSAGFTNLGTEDFMAAKIQGITPEFIQKVRSHGFTNLSLHQLMGLKMADVF